MTVPPFSPTGPAFQVVDADIWVGGTAPVGPDADDFWFDTTKVPLTGLDLIGIGATGVGGPPTTPPTGQSPGDAWIDGDGILWVWNGTDWVEFGPVLGPIGPTGPTGPASMVTGPTGIQGVTGPTGPTGPPNQLLNGLGTRVVGLPPVQRVDVAHDGSLEIVNPAGPEFLLSVSEQWLAGQITSGQVAAGPGLTGPTGSPPALAVHPVPFGGILVGPQGVYADPNWIANQTLAGPGLSSTATGVQTRTLEVGAGEGIVVNPDTVTLDRQWLGDFVNRVVFGALPHAPVDLATIAPVADWVNPSIDGLTPVLGQRVLVKNELPATANGIYVMGPTGLERAPDANEDRELTNGSFVTVIGGGTQANTSWQATITDLGGDGWTVDADANDWAPRPIETRFEGPINAPTPAGGTMVTHGLNQRFVHVSVFNPTDGTVVGVKVQCVDENAVNIFITDATEPLYTVVCSR